MNAIAPEAVASRQPRHLRRRLEGLAERAARVLSSRGQARLELRLEGVVRSSVVGLAGALGPLEQAVALAVGDGSSTGFVCPSRTLASGLLALRFGARLDAIGAAGARGYTRIEARAVARMAAEIWGAFDGVGVAGGRAPARILGLEDGARLREREDAPLWLATFSVLGLEPVERLFLALPIETAAASADGRNAILGGNDAIEAKRDMEPEGTDPSTGCADPDALPASRLKRSATRAACGLRLERGSTVALELGAVDAAVLRIDGSAIARGRRVAGTGQPTLRVEEILTARDGEGDDGR
jgi:hypothetical protein